MRMHACTPAVVPLPAQAAKGEAKRTISANWHNQQHSSIKNVISQVINYFFVVFSSSHSKSNYMPVRIRKRAAGCGSGLSELEYSSCVYSKKLLLAIMTMKTREMAKETQSQKVKRLKKKSKRVGLKHNNFSSFAFPTHSPTEIRTSQQREQEIAPESEAPALQAESEKTFSDVEDNSVSQPPLQFREKLGLFVHKYHGLTDACLSDLLCLLREEGHFHRGTSGIFYRVRKWTSPLKPGKCYIWALLMR